MAFPPNLAVTACGAQRWLLIDRTHCDSSPPRKSTSCGSHSLNWGQGVKRMVLHLWHQRCVCTTFSSLRVVKMGLLVMNGHQLCLSTCHLICMLPGGFPPCLALGWGWKVRRGWCGKAVVPASDSHTSPTALCSLRGGQVMRLRLSCAGFLLSSAGWRTSRLTSSSLKANKSRFATYSFPD